jgi:hypothetical protein
MVVNVNTAVIYHGTAEVYDGVFTIENVVNYFGIFRTLAPGINNIRPHSST